eukprot:1161973-Pelagomonas_calceolata.AAC.13
MDPALHWTLPHIAQVGSDYESQKRGPEPHRRCPWNAAIQSACCLSREGYVLSCRTQAERERGHRGRPQIELRVCVRNVGGAGVLDWLGAGLRSIQASNGANLIDSLRRAMLVIKT